MTTGNLPLLTVRDADLAAHVCKLELELELGLEARLLQRWQTSTTGLETAACVMEGQRCPQREYGDGGGSDGAYLCEAE